MDNDQNSTAENVKDALKADLEQTKSDMPGMDGEDLDQDVDDTVKQAAGKEEPPAV
ncbi:MAG TPA: hypothetical protein VM030_00025 [Acidimicrobiales bacterium]|nr:hypothetical protein [Acidimicrobiales bacterium]